jgi:hypothetical protein
MRYFLMVLGIGSVAGAVLTGAVALVLWPEPQLVVERVVEQVEVEVPATWEDHLQVETPAIDSLLTDEDWAEIDRESDCLFEFLQHHVGWDITLEAVMAAGDWTDVLGGACAVLEDGL